MKLRTHNPKVSSNGIIEENAFTIVASAKAFKILSSSLYKNKILAIIRELACNACDAHIDNGNPEVPFNIKLPTRLESVFKIRDFGTGLSHDNVMELYTTYFNSTKTESNDQTGALGLGSKSPFSYTPTFNVTSYYNNMMRSYSAFLDDNGMPKIVMLYETPSSEESGIEISFPAQETDHYEFRTNAKLALRHFDVRPVMLCGTIIEKVEYDVEYSQDDWKLLYSKNTKSVVQGNVEYPISLESIKNFPGNLYCFENMSIVFHFPIGTVEFAASREELSYDDYTSKILIDKFLKIYNVLVDDINNKILECDTKWEAQILINEIFNLDCNLASVLNSKHWMYNDEELMVKGSMDLTEDYKHIPLYIYGENKTGYTTSKRRYDKYKIIKISDKSGIIFNDLKSNFVKRINVYKESNNYRRVYEFKIGPDYNQDDVDNILKKLGNPKYSLASDLELPPKEKTELLYNIPSLNVNNSKYYASKFESEYYKAKDVIDLDQMYYVPMVGQKLANDIDIEDLVEITGAAINLNMINSDTIIYGFQKSVMKQVKKDYHINFLDYIVKCVKESDMWPELINYRKLPYVKLINNSYYINNIKDILKHTIVTDPQYIEMLKQYKRRYDYNTNHKLFTLNKLVSELDINFDYLNKDTNYIEIVYNKYPLLERIRESNSHRTETIFHEFELYVQNAYENSLNK